MLVGANLVVGADVVARTIAAPAEFPLDVFTALLLRQREAWNL